MISVERIESPQGGPSCAKSLGSIAAKSANLDPGQPLPLRVLTRKDFGDLTYIRPNSGDLIDAREPEHMGDRTSTVHNVGMNYFWITHKPKILDLLVLPDGIVITKPFEHLPSSHYQIISQIHAHL